MALFRSRRFALAALCVLCVLACVSAKRPLVRNVKTNREFRALLKHHAKNTGLPVIVDFFSHGCGPCRMIAPHFKRMAKEYRGRAVFAKVDVNVNRETSGAQQIYSMPTFQFYLGGRKRHQFSGGDLHGLQSWTRKLAREADRQNVRLTVENLRKFYAKHAPAGGGEGGEGGGEEGGGAHKSDEQLAAMIDKAGGAAGGPGHAKLAKALRKKYGKSPRLEKRLLDGKDGKDGGGKGGASSKGGGGRGSKGGKAKGGAKAAPEKPNLHLASVEQLKEELQNRADAEGFDPDAGEEADDEDEASEAAARWAANPDFPERVAVLGAGPAGLAAALYAARAGLRPVVLAPPMGGQLQGKGVTVENYPAVLGDTGPGIVALMATQAAEAGASFEPRLVTAVDLSHGSPFTVHVNETSFKAHSIIVATGAETRWLGVEGEQRYRGGGVSSCATCDGFLFRDQDVVVVGGGDTAMEDALVLARTSKSVTVVHRRDEFRASKILADRVKAHQKITIRWNATVARFSGKRVQISGNDAAADSGADADADADADAGADAGAEAGDGDSGGDDAAAASSSGEAQFLDKLTHVHLVDRSGEGEPEPFPCGAAFVAIGHDPSTSLFAGQLEMDGNGYLETRGKTTHTSVPGVFAAGDVADHVYRQAVTSAGTGAMAALDAERWLSEMGIKDEEAAMMDDIMAEIMAEGDSRVF